MSTEFKLPQVVSQSVWDDMMAKDPFGSLPPVVPYELLKKAVDGLKFRDLDYAESVLNAINVTNFNPEISTAIWEAYLVDEGQDTDRIRKYRFVCENCVRIMITDWRDNLLKKTLRAYPWLYWYHEGYRLHLRKTVEDFAERFVKDHQTFYRRSDFEDVCTAIRRIVSAEDRSFYGVVKKLSDAFENKNIVLSPEDRANNPFEPGRDRAFLKDAADFLQEDSSAYMAQKHDLSRVQEALQAEFGIRLILDTQFCTEKGGQIGVYTLRITPQDPDGLKKVSNQLRQTYLEVMLEGGYFPNRWGKEQRNLLISFPETGEIRLVFQTFPGKHRLRLRFTVGKVPYCRVIPFEV